MFEDIYNIFKLEMDGEEFDSDDDAILAANIAMRDILDNRDWKMLIKSATLPVGTLSLASLTDLDKVINVWASGDIEPLRRANYEQRFDTDFDYYIDLATNAIVLINTWYNTSALIVDYKYKPVDITSTNTPISETRLIPIIAYQMCLDYYDKDQDLSVYNNLEKKRDKAFDSFISYNENL